MSRILLHGARLIDPEHRAPPDARLLLRDDRIEALLGPGDEAPADARRVDCAGDRIAPGLIDLHDHGTLVFPPFERARDALQQASEWLARHGTTSFLATTVTLPGPALEDLVAAAGRAIEGAGFAGARPIGIHLEGPWISAHAAGAHAPQHVRGASEDEVARLIAAARGALRMVTFAPEVEGSTSLLARLQREGALPAIGHSMASIEALERAVSEGARHVTHLFNAMGSLHHRARGVAGFALADDRLHCDLICDGVHVHPDVVRIAVRAKGGRVVLITDRVALPESSAAGDAFGTAGLHDDGIAIRRDDGRLAGSSLTLDRALRNVQQFGAMTYEDALAACTLRPARLLGLEREIGTLRPGARADLVRFDAAGQVRETWIAGDVVYRAGVL